MAISVVVAVGDVADPLVDRLARKAREVRVGSALDPRSEMGPVITAEARERIHGYIDRGERAGARLVVDGRELQTHSDGYFVGPTLFDEVDTTMDLYTDEIFGPVLAVVRAGSLDEAIDLINANEYANGTALFSASGQTARTFQRDVQVGMIGINVPIPVPMAFYSFGGWKASLFGDTHMHGPEGIRFYTRAKVITSRWPQDPHGRHRDGGNLHFPTAV
jgi:malonate-semialdehyde dehydrogenase (acetylating)/methylmalonate-semialdehyde dehydrogenase